MHERIQNILDDIEKSGEKVRNINVFLNDPGTTVIINYFKGEGRQTEPIDLVRRDQLDQTLNTLAARDRVEGTGDPFGDVTQQGGNHEPTDSGHVSPNLHHPCPLQVSDAYSVNNDDDGEEEKEEDCDSAASDDDDNDDDIGEEDEGLSQHRAVAAAHNSDVDRPGDDEEEEENAVEDDDDGYGDGDDDDEEENMAKVKDDFGDNEEEVENIVEEDDDDDDDNTIKEEKVVDDDDDNNDDKEENVVEDDDDDDDQWLSRVRMTLLPGESYLGEHSTTQIQGPSKYTPSKTKTTLSEESSDRDESRFPGNDSESSKRAKESEPEETDTNSKEYMRNALYGIQTEYTREEFAHKIRDPTRNKEVYRVVQSKYTYSDYRDFYFNCVYDDVIVVLTYSSEENALYYNRYCKLYDPWWDYVNKTDASIIDSTHPLHPWVVEMATDCVMWICGVTINYHHLPPRMMVRTAN